MEWLTKQLNASELNVVVSSQGSLENYRVLAQGVDWIQKQSNASETSRENDEAVKCK